MGACTTTGLSSSLAHCKESPSSVLTAQKTLPGCWADKEIPREGVCGTLALFCCHLDGRGKKAASEKGKIAKFLAEKAGGTRTLPRDPGQPSSRVLGIQSAV